MTALEVMKIGGILVATKDCSLSEASNHGAIKEVNSDIDSLLNTVKEILLSDNKTKLALRKKVKLYFKIFILINQL